jgi:hypothetical protein
MDVLVALGTDASYFYSVISILHHRFVQHDAMHYVPTVSEEGGDEGVGGREGADRGGGERVSGLKEWQSNSQRLRWDGIASQVGLSKRDESCEKGSPHL